MPARRVDLIELQRLKDEGLSQAEICNRTSWSKAAVSKNLRALSMAKCGVVLRSAEEIKHRTLKAEDRILRLDQITHDTLEEIAQRVKLASSQERERLEGHQLRYLEEGRKQMVAWADIRQKLLVENEVKLLKKVVYEKISKVDPEVANEIFREFDEQNLDQSILR